MTEAEAKTKWCPFVRVGMYGANATTGGNRTISAAMPDSLNCIASACMAWRTKILVETKDGVIVTSSIDDGWCGLAGEG